MTDLELRVALAREVFGREACHAGGMMIPCPRYESTYEGMGLVIERMRELGWTSFAMSTCEEGWYADFMRPMQAIIRETASTAPRAVALAALAAVRSEK